jgi:hypothetical protein
VSEYAMLALVALALCIARVGSAVVGGRSLRVVTVASNLGDPRLVYASASAQHFGLELTVLGAGRKAWWPEGLGLKINLVREYALSLANEEDVILVVDAYDAIVLADAAEILRRFDAFPKGTTVFNGEQGCFPAHFAALYPSDVSPWHHLNSGAYIGTAGSIKRLIPAPVPEVIEGSDQAWFQDRYVGRESGFEKGGGGEAAAPGERWGIAVDTKCTIFQINVNLDLPGYEIDWRGASLELAPGAIDAHPGVAVRNTRWNTHPVVLHFAGPGHWAGKFGVTALSRVFKRVFPAESARRERRFECQFPSLSACGRHLLIPGLLIATVALAIVASWTWWWRRRLHRYVALRVESGGGARGGGG